MWLQALLAPHRAPAPGTLAHAHTPPDLLGGLGAGLGGGMGGAGAMLGGVPGGMLGGVPGGMLGVGGSGGGGRGGGGGAAVHAEDFHHVAPPKRLRMSDGQRAPPPPPTPLIVCASLLVLLLVFHCDRVAPIMLQVLAFLPFLCSIALTPPLCQRSCPNVYAVCCLRLSAGQAPALRAALTGRARSARRRPVL